MKHKCKELALKDATLLCGKCQQEVSLLKTVSYVSHDMHQAKCVFGHLRRVEEAEAIKNLDTVYKDQDNRDFISLYLDIFAEKKEAESKVEQPPKPVYKSYVNNQLTYEEPPPKYAFAECRNHHILGIIID